MTEMIKNATRITKSSETLIDHIFTNKEERITKAYNLITGISDHNLTLIVRRLFKMRYKTCNRVVINSVASYISKKDLELFNTEIEQIQRNQITCGKNCQLASNDFMITFNDLPSKYSKESSRKIKGKIPLPWMNESTWNLMKLRDAALKVLENWPFDRLPSV